MLRGKTEHMNDIEDSATAVQIRRGVISLKTDDIPVGPARQRVKLASAQPLVDCIQHAPVKLIRPGEISGCQDENPVLLLHQRPLQARDVPERQGLPPASTAGAAAVHHRMRLLLQVVERRTVGHRYFHAVLLPGCVVENVSTVLLLDRSRCLCLLLLSDLLRPLRHLSPLILQVGLVGIALSRNRCCSTGAGAGLWSCLVVCVVGPQAVESACSRGPGGLLRR
mmetsp:Transcript_124633/g.285478  ORF Transcript_124633/g.285478 Transcript_124633/m.285478 type:complete len:224 (-) Transcript_124633:324-995(-)